MSETPDELDILAPVSTKSKLDYLHREVQHAAGRRINRREALGVAGLAFLAAACGTTTGSSSSSAAGGSSSGLAGQPLGSSLQIYNWSQYDAPSTYKDFMNQPAEKAAGLKINETYYSSNDELLAKLNAGNSGYDVIVPSQNAVAQLIEEGKLLALDDSLLPNLKYLDPAFRKSSFDTSGKYHIIKDYGVTLFFYQNTVVTDDLKTMHDFYEALPKWSSKGRTNILDGAEEVVPLALMAIGLDPNTDSAADFAKVKTFLLSIRNGVSTIDSSNYINDSMAGKIILGQGWSGDVRRIVEARKKQGDITPVLPTGTSEIWADNWCIPAEAPHPVAAHAWLNWLLTPSVAVNEMNYHSYPIPIPTALAQVPKSTREDPLFNVPRKYTDGYKYILNVSPSVVQQRTQIYSEFKAA
jgi:spermidine/putrescine transport system substrate-binding protein